MTIPEMSAEAAAYMEELEREAAKCGGDVHRAQLRIARRRADKLIKDAVQRARADTTDWIALARGLGRNDMPFLLLMVWDHLSREQKIAGLSAAWTSAEFPEHYLLRAEWLNMFRTVGYLEEDKPGVCPKQITLWRGGVKKTRMAWTADREQAVWFQHRQGSKPGKLWTATVGPDRLLAHFHEQHRREHEYVIDPTGLRPTEIR
ncbi:MAG: hypothetical protein HYZ38_12965 [Mycobacterium sp.]|nr:hypothetical protein [Mycobacterium sp.]